MAFFNFNITESNFRIELLSKTDTDCSSIFEYQVFSDEGDTVSISLSGSKFLGATSELNGVSASMTGSESFVFENNLKISFSIQNSGLPGTFDSTTITLLSSTYPQQTLTEEAVRNSDSAKCQSIQPIFDDLLDTPEDKIGHAGEFLKVSDDELTLEYVDINSSVSYVSSLPDNLDTPDDVGGIDKGTLVSELEGKTFSELFDKLLYPTIYPIIASYNSTSLSDNVSNLQTIGSTINIELTTSVNFGSISLNGITQSNYAGAVTGALISGPNSTSYTPTIGVTEVVSSHVVFEGSNQWSIVTTFGEGPMPTDTANDDYPSIRFAAGGTKSSSTSFEGVYPIQIGTSGGGFTERSLVSHGSSVVAISQNYSESGSLRHRFAVANDMLDLKTVSFQQWNPAAGIYQDIKYTDFNQSQTTFDVEGLSVNYTLYTKSGNPGGGDSPGKEIYKIKLS
jgi:hypothetical protein